MRRNLIESILQTVPKCQHDNVASSLPTSGESSAINHDELISLQTPQPQLQPLQQQQQHTSKEQTQQQQSKIPTRLSRENSNLSVSSYGNREHSVLSTTSTSSSCQSQLPRSQLDYKQLVAKVSISGFSSPIRSFQRATISSAVKTKIYDKNPQLLNYTNTPDSEPQSLNYSETSSPSNNTTPVHFNRSRSLRMSSGIQKPSYGYQQYSTNQVDNYNNDYINSYTEESQAIIKLLEENRELRENVEFGQCELAVMKQTINSEREIFKKEKADLIEQLAIKEAELNEIRMQMQTIQDELSSMDSSFSPTKSEDTPRNIEQSHSGTIIENNSTEMNGSI